MKSRNRLITMNKKCIKVLTYIFIYMTIKYFYICIDHTMYSAVVIII